MCVGPYGLLAARLPRPACRRNARSRPPQTHKITRLTWAYTRGIRHVAFAVEDIDAVVAGLRARGAELVGELERYADSHRLCYVRGPGNPRRASGADRLTGRARFGLSELPRLGAIHPRVGPRGLSHV